MEVHSLIWTALQDTYRSLRRETKRSTSSDRIATLEKEALELDDAFRLNRFKGYRLLKQQHRTRTKAVMPPEADFTEHYRTHYQLGTEEPLEVHDCTLPASLFDDT